MRSDITRTTEDLLKFVYEVLRDEHIDGVWIRVGRTGLVFTETQSDGCGRFRFGQQLSRCHDGESRYARIGHKLFCLIMAFG